MRGEERTCRERRGISTMAELACDFFTEGTAPGRPPPAVRATVDPPALNLFALGTCATRGASKIRRSPAYRRDAEHRAGAGLQVLDVVVPARADRCRKEQRGVPRAGRRRGGQSRH